MAQVEARQSQALPATPVQPVNRVNVPGQYVQLRVWVRLVLQGKGPQRQGFGDYIYAQIGGWVARPFVMVTADQGDAQRRVFAPPLFQCRERARCV